MGLRDEIQQRENALHETQKLQQELQYQGSVRNYEQNIQATISEIANSIFEIFRSSKVSNEYQIRTIHKAWWGGIKKLDKTVTEKNIIVNYTIELSILDETSYDVGYSEGYQNEDWICRLWGNRRSISRVFYGVMKSLKREGIYNCGRILNHENILGFIDPEWSNIRMWEDVIVNTQSDFDFESIGSGVITFTVRNTDIITRDFKGYPESKWMNMVFHMIMIL